MTDTTRVEVAEEEESHALPPLVDGEMAQVLSVELLAKQTRPPVRFTEGSLITEMKNAGKYVQDAALRTVLKEVSGLGTSATRDSIIETLKRHGYLMLSGKHLVPTGKGEDLARWLDKSCGDLLDVELTARWEAALDLIAAKGGGAAFERAVVAKLGEMVTMLRGAGPMSSTPTPDPQPAKTPRSRGSRSQGTARTSHARKTAPAGGTGRVNRPAQGHTLRTHTSAPSSPSGARGAPTERMLDYATKIAARLGIRLPDEVSKSFDDCRRFLDQNTASAARPTPKQLAFAERIAREKGLQIPPKCFQEGRNLSQWIDANK